MNVVSNTSPIIFLSKIEALDLLRKAQSKGLKTIGTIGVLLLAHQQQFIS